MVAAVSAEPFALCRDIGGLVHRGGDGDPERIGEQQGMRVRPPTGHRPERPVDRRRLLKAADLGELSCGCECGDNSFGQDLDLVDRGLGEAVRGEHAALVAVADVVADGAQQR